MPILNDVFIERGAKRVFAGAIEWPGWCRSGRTEEAALETLLAYGPRYAKALGRRRLGFVAPADVVDLRVVERRTGNATTDFGAPAIAPQADDRPIGPEEAKRLAAIMEACWASLDRAAAAAEGHVLSTGPRGGGRQLVKIVAHVADAEGAYRSKLGALPGRRGREGRNPGGVRIPRTRGTARTYPAFGRAVVAPLLHPASRLARARSGVGDRGPVAARVVSAFRLPRNASISVRRAPSVAPLKRSALRPKPFGKDLPGRPGPWTQQNCFATRWSGGRATST